MGRIRGLRAAVIVVKMLGKWWRYWQSWRSGRTPKRRARAWRAHLRRREHVERPEARPGCDHELPRLPGARPDLRRARAVQRQPAADPGPRDQLEVQRRQPPAHLPAPQGRQVHRRHDLHLGGRRRLARARPEPEDERRVGLVHLDRQEGRPGRAVRSQARTLPPGHLDPRRADLGQPGDALDQGDHCGHALEDTRWHRTVRVRQLDAEQLLHRRCQPQLLGRQGHAAAGRDQDDPLRAVDRLGAAGA